MARVNPGVIANELSGKAGAIIFTATGSNAPQVRVELLCQKLTMGHQAVQPDRYRTQAFVAFAPGSLSHVVPVTPGWAAPAYRFVNALTGQATDLVPLPVVQVEQSE